MSSHLKLGLGLFGLVAVACTGMVAAGRPQATSSSAAPAPIPVTAAEVQRQDVPIVLEGLGTVQALNTATLHTQVEGTLERVDYTEGQTVKRGQELAQIDPRTAQAQLDQAIAALGRDQAHLTNARANLARFTPLLSHGYATAQQVDTQNAQVAQLQNIVKADQAAIDAARTLLSYTTIAAPFDGVTGMRLIDPGNIVHPTDATGLVVVTQVQPITVVFPLPAADIPDVQQALARGEVQAAAYAPDDRTELDEGRLLLIDNQADPTTGTVRLKAVFPNPERKLWPGTFVNVHLVASVQHNGLTVPLSAVQQGPQGPYVYVVKPDGTAAMRPVVVGQSRNNQVLVSSGLAAGEKVVTGGHYRLTEDARVAVVTGGETSLVQASSTASAGMLP